MQRASPLNSSRDRATLSRPCCPLLHPASARAVLLVVPSLVFFLARPPIYSRFFVVFAYGEKVIMVLYALLDPSSFLPAKTNLHLHHPDCRLLVSFLLSLFVVLLPSSYVSFVPSAALVRPRPFLLRLVMTKSCTTVNRHPPLPVFSR